MSQAHTADARAHAFKRWKKPLTVAFFLLLIVLTMPPGWKLSSGALQGVGVLLVLSLIHI